MTFPTNCRAWPALAFTMLVLAAHGFAETPSLVVTTTADVVGDDGQISLREALAYAATLTGSPTITFSSTTANGAATNFFDGAIHTITLTGTELDIATNVTIAGPGAKVLIISGNQAISVFNVVNTATVEFDGLTIANGNGSGSGGLSGGITNAGVLTIANCTLSGNATNTIGGAISNSGTLTLTGSILSTNSATINGGALDNSGTATLTNDTVINSFSPGDGGAISNSGGTLTITASTVSNNTSGNLGGGISNDATLTLANCTIANNTARVAGGGIENGTGQVQCTNCTIANNSAATNGGINNAATFTLNNTIVAGNSTGDIGGAAADFTSSCNLIQNDSGSGLSNGVNGNQIGADPRLRPLQFNGGTTPTMALASSSPAIDGGSNAKATAAGLTTDQRGFSRVVNGTADIGAYEFNPAPIKIIGSGESAPGAGTNDLPANAVLTELHPPAIDNDGNVAFAASWKGSGSVKHSGIFTSFGFIAASGVNVDTHATFSDPVIDSGHVAYFMKVKSKTFLFSDAPSGTLAQIAATGDVAPGTNGAKFASLREVEVAGRRVGFLATLTPGTGNPRVTAANEIGLWAQDSTNALTLVLRTGQPIGTTTIKKLVSFLAGNGCAGQGRGWLGGTDTDAAVSALTINADKTQCVVTADIAGAATQSITILSQSGPNSTTGNPNIGGAHFLTYSVPASASPDDSAFLATIAGSSIGQTNNRGIFFHSINPFYEPVAQLNGDTGLTAGAPHPHATFSAFKDPVLGTNGRLAFPATIKGGGFSGAATRTLWWMPPGQNLSLLVQGGQLATDTAGNATTAVWSSFSTLAINDIGPIFIGTLTGHGVTAANNSGLWALDLAGKEREIVRTGVTQVGSSTVHSFTLLQALPGSTGDSRSFNASGSIVWLTTLSDKTQAIVRSEVP